MFTSGQSGRLSASVDSINIHFFVGAKKQLHDGFYTQTTVQKPAVGRHLSHVHE